MSAPPPLPLRVLLVWPEPRASALWRELQLLRPRVDVTLIPASALADYLEEAGYYHVLHVTPEHWRSLAPRQRIRLAGRVTLVVLGPGPAAADDLAGVASGLYLPDVPGEFEGAALVLQLHQRLAGGHEIGTLVAGSSGRWALAGEAPAWPGAPGTPSATSGQRSSTAAGAAATGPGARATSATPGSAYAEQRTPASTAGIAIGTIVVQGDMVTGEKIVHHAEGDQINLNRGTSTAGKVEQRAGGDQININRPAGAPAARHCPSCGQPVRAADRFCQSCGTRLDGGAQTDPP